MKLILQWQVIDIAFHIVEFLYDFSYVGNDAAKSIFRILLLQTPNS